MTAQKIYNLKKNQEVDAFERRALEAESKLSVVDAFEKKKETEAENKLFKKEIEVTSLRSLALTLQTDLNSFSVDKKKVIEEKVALEAELIEG